MARVALAVPFYDTRFIRPVLGPRYLESFLAARGHDVLFLDSGLAGLKQVFLSLESGTGGGLRRLGRDHSLKGSRKAVRILESLAGMQTN